MTALLEPTVVAALLALAGTLLLPLLSARLKVRANGRIEAAAVEIRRIDQATQLVEQLRALNNDLQEAAEEAQGRLERAREVNLELERARLRWEVERETFARAMADMLADMEAFRRDFADLLAQHAALQSWLVRVEDRLRRGISGGGA